MSEFGPEKWQIGKEQVEGRFLSDLTLIPITRQTDGEAVAFVVYRPDPINHVKSYLDARLIAHMREKADPYGDRRNREALMVVARKAIAEGSPAVKNLAVKLGVMVQDGDGLVFADWMFTGEIL